MREGAQPRYLYLIGDEDRRFCKVGHSIHPNKRLRALQTGCPLLLVILESIPIPQWKNSTSTLVSAKLYEREVHRILRKRGLKAPGGTEWFMYSPGILASAVAQFPDHARERITESCAFAQASP